jgi:hypothetical protein
VVTPLETENPYTPFEPATEDFCGRLAFIERFADTVRSGLPAKHLLITGVGGIGKSSLLMRMYALCPELGLRRRQLINLEPVGDDAVRAVNAIRNALSGLQRIGLAKRFALVARKISVIPQVSIPGLPIAVGIPARARQQITASEDFDVVTRELAEDLSTAVTHGEPVVVLLDQLERVLEWPLGAKSFCQVLMRALRATRASRVRFVLACRPDGKGDIEHYLEPGLFDPRFIEHWPLGPLSMEESREAITEPAARNGVRFSDQVVQVLLQECGGHPYSIQLICYHLWEHLLRSGSLTPLVQIEPSAIEAVLQDAQGRMFREAFEEVERSILKVLALARIPLRESEVLERVRARYLIDEVIARGSLERLLKRHGNRPIKFVEGKYSFTHDLFADYILDSECRSEERELEVIRGEVGARMLAWHMGDYTPLHKSTVERVKAYLSELNPDADTLKLILISEAVYMPIKTARRKLPKRVEMYMSQFGFEQCKPALMGLLASGLPAEVIDRVMEVVGQFSEEYVAELRPTSDLLKTPIEHLNLSVRTYSVLRRAKLNTVGAVMRKTAGELLALRHFGRRSLEELESKIAALGLVGPWTLRPTSEAEKRLLTLVRKTLSGRVLPTKNSSGPVQRP